MRFRRRLTWAVAVRFNPVSRDEGIKVAPFVKHHTPYTDERRSGLQASILPKPSPSESVLVLHLGLPKQFAVPFSDHPALQ